MMVKTICMARMGVLRGRRSDGRGDIEKRRLTRYYIAFNSHYKRSRSSALFENSSGLLHSAVVCG